MRFMGGRCTCNPPAGRVARIAAHDLPAAEALCRWLVDGEDPTPPGDAADAPRAVRVRALG